jgi:hypothetical protein
MFLEHVEGIHFKQVREGKLVHCPLCDKVGALHSENTTLGTIASPFSGYSSGSEFTVLCRTGRSKVALMLCTPASTDILAASAHSSSRGVFLPLFLL